MNRACRQEAGPIWSLATLGKVLFIRYRFLQCQRMT
jgi:hypothetical protein